MRKWILLVAGASLVGCEKPPTDYEYFFEKPEIMEEEPEGADVGGVRWIWYTKDRLISVTYIIDRQPGEILDSPKTLKAALEEKVGLILKSEFTEEAPKRFHYQHKGKKGWEFIVAEETPDHLCTCAIFGIYPAVTAELFSAPKAETILESMKSGRFEKSSPSKETDQSRVTSEIQER